MSSVQASIAANTWVVSGTPQTKSKLPLIYLAYIIKMFFDLMGDIAMFNMNGV